MTELIPTCTHWGNYLVERRGDEIIAVHPYAVDATPTPIGQSLINARDAGCRIPQPMIRKSYLQRGWESDGTNRGREPFIPVSWDDALDIAASALRRVRTDFGNESIYGGSYGWASAGRFHHAQSQVHRFLNTIGGYTYSVNTYSTAAAEVIMPHILGISFYDLILQAPTVADMIEHSGLVVCFGGIPIKNTQVMSGGLGAHTAERQLGTLKEAGLEFVNISPVRDDMSELLRAEWWPIRPNSDVALMLGIAHTLLIEERHDKAFLEEYCTGFDRMIPYLLGETDGQPKDADWASHLSEIPADNIRLLARRMSKTRTVIGISWSLQRSQHGEQSYWMATLLAAMLGSHGLPGGGIAYGYGSIHNIGFSGRRLPPYKVSSLPRGTNAVRSFVPVARISDLLLNPGDTIDYNGQTLTFPDIRLVYWAGGNPFHHHQDLNRLRRAWARPETVIVNEPFWTAAARHADIVFPCTTPLERNDFGASPHDCYLSPMRKVVEAFADSRNDYDVFCGLASRLGTEGEFTEGRDEMAWVEHLYAETRSNAEAVGIELPDFPGFWAGQQFTIEDQAPAQTYPLERFRRDPHQHPLSTPSGKIELYSKIVAAFDYDDCGAHPMWYDKEEWLGSERAQRYPLHLISNQPRTRLHSQYDHGITSRKAKIEGREAARMHPEDAESRGIADGAIIRVFNDRGACLAGVRLTELIRPGVIELATGAWYDPLNPGESGSLEVHGNPNVLTRDVGTSKLAQGPTAHSCLVEVQKFDGPLPPIKIFDQPPTEA